jgi:hypothetical protein
MMVGNVDFSAKRVWVRQQPGVEVKGRLVLNLTPKGGRSRAVVVGSQLAQLSVTRTSDAHGHASRSVVAERTGRPLSVEQLPGAQIEATDLCDWGRGEDAAFTERELDACEWITPRHSPSDPPLVNTELRYLNMLYDVLIVKGVSSSPDFN